MEFDESDLRPMTGLQRPMTGEINMDEDAVKIPGNRPVTTKPVASRRPSTNRPMTSMQGRPITSMASRPTTGFVPDWMYKEEAMERPKTGYNKTSRQDGQDRQVRRCEGIVGMISCAYKTNVRLYNVLSS